MKGLLYKILFFSTIAVLLVFTAQTVAPFAHFEPLNGVTEELEKPELTFRNYANGSLQNYIDAYLREHFGFREPLIRYYNQFLMSCFHETNNENVLIGKDGWLFGQRYVRNYYESLMYEYTDDTAKMREVFETEALRLWKVQELLKEYDIHIFVNITPSKDVVYPDYLPKNRTYLRPDGLHAYDYYKKRFDELGIQYIDWVPVFQKIRDSVDYQLFPKLGTHWSNIASAYAFDSIIRYMEVIGNQNLVNLDIGERFQSETREPDNDLELLLNLASPIKSPPNQYAEVRVIRDTTASKPYFTVVGDSFYWNIVYNVPLWETFRKYPYWYYNHTIHGDENYKYTLDVDPEKELMRTDYIMLTYGPASLYEFSSCFLPRTLLHLCYDKAAIDSTATEMIKGWKSDPEKFEYYEKVSKTSQTSMDQIMRKDAMYLLRMHPEDYFDDLKGAKLPASRNSNLKTLRKELSAGQS